MADTVKRVRDHRVMATVPRDDLVTVQTPQAFRRAALEDAHAAAGVETDDAALVEAAGGTVVVVDGEPGNLKLTRPEDLGVLRALAGCEAQQQPQQPPRPQPPGDHRGKA
jgi:2-C-methyl-D-erythritol 4-phosphate cytidylyltransferase